MCVRTYVWESAEDRREHLKTLELELQADCEPPDRGAENLGSLQKQEVLITTKPSLQLLSAVF